MDAESTTRRTSTRVSRPTSRLSGELQSAAVSTKPPPHPSTHPIDASAYTDRYLKRAKTAQKHWLKHLDFINMPLERIKSLFWTTKMERDSGGQCNEPPLALRRTKKNIVDFWGLGVIAQADRIATWGKFDAELKAKFCCAVDTDVVVSHGNVEEVVDNDWEMVNWCPGFTINDVHTSKLSEERKEVVEVGL